MIVQPKQFDLAGIEPNFNIVIITAQRPYHGYRTGYNGDSALKRNILHILREKQYLINKSKFKYESKYFKFIISDNTIWTKNGKELMDYGNALFFVHSSHYSAEIIINQYYKSLKIPINSPTPYNLLKQYLPSNTFFVMRNGPIELYIPECSDTYLKFYNEKPFCYNNVMKLTTNISKKFSMFHGKKSNLYEQLQTRLKELDVICCYICYMKNNDNNIWLPNELNLEIMKLFFLLYVK